MKRLALALAGAALCAGSAAAASAPVTLKSRDFTLQPSATTIRLVASKTNLDAKRKGRVALWLTLYRKAHLGFRKVKETKVATGFKLSSRLVSIEVEKPSGTQHENTAEIHVKWLVSPSVGKRTYSFVATRTRLVRRS